MKKKSKVKLSPLEYKIMRDSARAHKEVLDYFKDKELKVDIETALEDPLHSKYLTPRYEIITAAREIAINKKYKIIKDSIKIHHLRTSDEGSRTTQYRARKKLEKEREESVFKYPDGIYWTNELRDEYRTLFKIHYNSGMGEEAAQTLTLKELGLD